MWNKHIIDKICIGFRLIWIVRNKQTGAHLYQAQQFRQNKNLFCQNPHSLFLGGHHLYMWVCSVRLSVTVSFKVDSRKFQWFLKGILGCLKEFGFFFKDFEFFLHQIPDSLE